MTDWMLGTVARRDDGQLGVRLDGAEKPLRRKCSFPAGVTPVEGMRVLLCRYSGVYIVAAAYAQSTLAQP